jgi:hypothetical protein
MLQLQPLLLPRQLPVAAAAALLPAAAAAAAGGLLHPHVPKRLSHTHGIQLVAILWASADKAAASRNKADGRTYNDVDKD